MKVHRISAALLLIFIIEIASSTYTSVVETSNGPVRGRLLKTVRRNVPYASFQGIPYAKSPEGELRFQPPVEVERWSEVFDADREGSACIQFSEINNVSMSESENCLFLNVHTPHLDFAKINENNLKPVMVWIHGGGYSSGTSTTNRQGPDFILEEDVIVVSMNYRLGPLGFLNLNHKNASGNMGLKDQNLALKWVKKNINKFGGDPNKVTIFGQSAGSVSVDFHILSDMSAGLFSQSICMSGSVLDLMWGMQSSSDAYSQAKQVASNLGSKARNKEEILKVLKTASVEDIAKAIKNPVVPFRPTIERTFDVNNEKFLSKCAIDKYRSGEYNKGPHMMGFTSLELKPVTDLDISKLINRGNEILNNASISLNNTSVEPFLRFGSIGKIWKQAAYKELANILSKLFFVAGIDAKQKLLLRHNKYPVYYYRFCYDSDLPTEIDNRHSKFNISGVQHADDLMYLFYFSPIQLNKNPGIELTINRFVKLLTNFAKYGNPTPDGRKDDILKVTWPNSGTLGLHLEINKKLTVGPRPISVDVNIFQALGIGSSRRLNDCF